MTSLPSSESHKTLYARFIDLLNQQDFDTIRQELVADNYREVCVGFTPGWVNYDEGVTSLKQVLVGIPDLRARIIDSVANEGKVYARLTVRGTNTGRFYGAPATNRAYTVNMFDYVRIENGRIVERVQQSDTLSQMRQIYGNVLKWIGLGAGLGIVSLLPALARK